MGVDTSANSFARSCAYAGYWVFGKREYHSNITGEHSYFVVTVSDREVYTFRDPIDILVTFEPRTLRLHINDVKSGGAVIYDSDEDISWVKRDDIIFVPIPYNEIIKETAQKFGLKDMKKLQVMRNSISVFASASVIGLEAKFVEMSMDYIFTGKRRKVLEPNKYAGLRAYEIAGKYREKFPTKMPHIQSEKRAILTGNQATAIGKLVAGCRFQTYYPITPATDESEFLESLAKNYGIIVVQTEDEIAAICMSIGASLSGARASSSTSGPGFSLMAEALGWAGMNEVPVVIVDYQRGGPSTGMPTRHEQGDLKFAVYAGHGEFPKVVLAPGDIEEALYVTAEAFNIADKFQCPVIILEDKFVANSIKTVRLPDISRLKIERGKFLNSIPQDDSKQSDGKINKFKRFEFTEDGISTRIPIGTTGFIFWNSGDEHDEYGHITESPENRTKMHEKRMKKLAKIIEETPDDFKLQVYGDIKSEYAIVSWGSTKGSIISAIEELEKEGLSFLFIQVRMIHPLDGEIIKKLISGKVKICVEQNWSGQLAGLITEATAEKFDYLILKWNGRPISHDEMKHTLKKIVLAHKTVEPKTVPSRFVLQGGI